MKIPKRISPDNLKDSIVQILFNSDVQPELFLGVFSRVFNEDFTFTGTFPQKKELKIGEKQEIIFEKFDKGFFLDMKKEIKVDVTGNSVIFNMFKNYIGWENYFPLINKTIKTLFEGGFIKEINRIGIRYISQFDNISLIDNLNMNLSLDIPNKNLESTQIRTEYIENEFKIILTLINRIRNPEDSKTNSRTNTSIIDIDVIQVAENMNNSHLALEAILNGHQKQKSTFFSLLRPSFLETLKPEY